MPEQLHIRLDELEACKDRPLTASLLLGRVVATVVSRKTGEHITVQLKCRRKEGGKWVPCRLWQASRVFADVPNTSDWPAHGNDKVGTYYPEGDPKYSGLFWADRAADPARVWACLFVLRAAAGRTVSDRAELLLGVNCLHCGRELTDDESIERSMGPDCYGKSTGGHHQRKGEDFVEQAPAPERASGAQSGSGDATRGATAVGGPEGSDRLTMAQGAPSLDPHQVAEEIGSGEVHEVEEEIRRRRGSEGFGCVPGEDARPAPAGMLFRPPGASYKDVVAAR